MTKSKKTNNIFLHWFCQFIGLICILQIMQFLMFKYFEEEVNKLNFPNIILNVNVSYCNKTFFHVVT